MHVDQVLASPQAGPNVKFKHLKLAHEPLSQPRTEPHGWWGEAEGSCRRHAGGAQRTPPLFPRDAPRKNAQGAEARAINISTGFARAQRTNVCVRYACAHAGAQSRRGASAEKRASLR